MVLVWPTPDDMDLEVYRNVETSTAPGLVENWTLTCERAGRVVQRAPVVIDRGQQRQVHLTGRGRR